MWMDMALARQSGQELINHYIIRNSPATAHIRLFYHASIRHLTATYQRIAAEQAFNNIRPSVCDQMRQEMATIKEEFDPLIDEASGYSPSMVQDGVVRQSRLWLHHAGRPQMTRQGSPRLWIRHAGRPQWIRLWNPRWWRRHAGRLQATTARWR